jgi:hypothetical protein
VRDDSYFGLGQKLLVENGSVRQGVVMVKQPGQFSPNFGATASHVFTQMPRNVAVEPGMHSLASWTTCLCYHECCINGVTSPEYFGFHLVETQCGPKVLGLFFLIRRRMRETHNIFNSKYEYAPLSYIQAFARLNSFSKPPENLSFFDLI